MYLSFIHTAYKLHNHLIKRVSVDYQFYFMNHIELFQGQAKKQTSIHHISHEKRPPNINVSKVHSNNHKWKQCKIIGKNISIRSYSAACPFNKKLYLYGGYQILNGSLSDFYSISLNQQETTFIWEEIVSKGEVHPGSRTKHALLGGKTQIYLVGGLLKNNKASNQIFSFDPQTKQWKLLKPDGVKLPAIESFSAVIVNKSDSEKIVIAFGFNEEKASLSNVVYEYDIAKNKLSILFEGTQKAKADAPSPRTGCSIATDNTNVYIFGGKDESNRLNDIWSFNLTDFKFYRLKDDGELPAIRNGHTMDHYQGKLYVFGGIHDITWQLDDLHIYNIKSNKWTTLEQDSPRKIERKNNNQHQQLTIDEKQLERNKSKKKNWYDTHTAGLHKPVSPRNFNLTYNEETVNKTDQSPGKMLDQQRRKVFFLKKAEMLKNFQIDKSQKQKLVILETASQAMKNSLDVIGNPDPKLKPQEDRLTDFGKESISKFLQPLQNTSNIVIGKKPCARDGHCSIIIGDELVIFGGDRHQMSFNDIYKLNLKLAEKQVHGT